MDSTQGSAGIPPDGTTPNFINPPSLSPVYRGIIYSFVPLMVVFLVCRLYVRLRQHRELWLDDLLCILGAGSIIAYCGVLIPVLDKPLGRHLWDVPISDITDRYLKYSTVILVMFFLGALFVKLTLLIFYLRLFKIHRLVYWLIWGGVAAVSAFYLVSIVLILDKCVPRGGQTWLATAFTGDCTPVQNGVSKASGIFGLVSDFYILAIPVGLISQLTFPTGRKLGVLAVFLTGLIACGFSAAGLAARFQWKQSDGTYSMLYVFGILELNIGNICACMPILTPLFRRIVETSSSVWHSVNHYYRHILTRNQYKNEGNTTKESNSANGAQGQLPEIPRGAFTGVRTFIRKNHRSIAEDTELQTHGDATVLLTQDSASQDYHSQLKKMFLHDVESGFRVAPSSSGTGSQSYANTK